MRVCKMNCTPSFFTYTLRGLSKSTYNNTLTIPLKEKDAGAKSCIFPDKRFKLMII